MVLKPGTGKRTINNRTFTEYFRNEIREMIVEQPLTVDESETSNVAAAIAEPAPILVLPAAKAVSPARAALRQFLKSPSGVAGAVMMFLWYGGREAKGSFSINLNIN